MPTCQNDCITGQGGATQQKQAPQLLEVTNPSFKELEDTFTYLQREGHLHILIFQNIDFSDVYQLARLTSPVCQWVKSPAPIQEILDLQVVILFISLLSFACIWLLQIKK